MTTQYGMLIDTTRCMGCQTCVVSCKLSNAVPGDIYWGRVVSPDGDRVYRPSGTFPNVKLAFRPELCNHCGSPACVAECPTGAMHQARRGRRGAVGPGRVHRMRHLACRPAPTTCRLDEEANRSSKCTLCYDRLAADKLPWCVQACPARRASSGT